MRPIVAITVLHAAETRNEDLVDTWPRLYPKHPLEVVQSTGRLFHDLRRYVENQAEAHPDSFITVVTQSIFVMDQAGGRPGPVQIPINGEGGDIKGVELSGQYAFDWGGGFRREGGDADRPRGPRPPRDEAEATSAEE